MQSYTTHLIIIIITIQSLALKLADLTVSRETEAVRRTQMAEWEWVEGEEVVVGVGRGGVEGE